MKPELIISIIALALSVLSIILTVVFTLRQIRTTSILESNAAIIDVEKALSKVPSALKFHGIKEDDLTQANITTEEFAYLLTSFTAGAIYYRTLLNANDDPFEEGSYRYIMCSQSSTRKAWPIIRKMMSNHVFRKKMDKTIAIIEETEKEVMAKSA
ncbi:MAG: hypothetical protein WBV94_10065 [Blastocatellia bacterium]